MNPILGAFYVLTVSPIITDALVEKIMNCFLYATELRMNTNQSYLTSIHNSFSGYTIENRSWEPP